MRKLRVKITQSKSGSTDLSPGGLTPWKNTLDGSLASIQIDTGQEAASSHHSRQSLVSTFMTSCMLRGCTFCHLLHPHRETGIKRGRTRLCNQGLRDNGRERRRWQHFFPLPFLMLQRAIIKHPHGGSPSQQDSAFTCLPCKAASREKAAQFPHYLIALWQLLPSLSRLISQMRRMN